MPLLLTCRTSFSPPPRSTLKKLTLWKCKLKSKPPLSSNWLRRLKSPEISIWRSRPRPNKSLWRLFRPSRSTLPLTRTWRSCPWELRLNRLCRMFPSIRLPLPTPRVWMAPLTQLMMLNWDKNSPDPWLVDFIAKFIGLCWVDKVEVKRENRFYNFFIMCVGGMVFIYYSGYFKGWFGTY